MILQRGGIIETNLLICAYLNLSLAEIYVDDITIVIYEYHRTFIYSGMEDAPLTLNTYNFSYGCLERHSNEANREKIFYYIHLYICIFVEVL